MEMLKREIYLEKIRNFYDSDLIKILVGIRRSGKSVILSQIIQELKEKGIKADIIREEPFVEAQDSVQYKIYLMKWKQQRGNYTTEIEEITI